MTDVEMTDAEVRQQVERADRSIAEFREMVAGTAVDPATACADYHRRGLERIAATLNAVPFVTMCNLANINAAMRGGLMDLIGVRLMCRRWSDTGLRERGGIPARVRVHDREGAQTAAAMTGWATCPSLSFNRALHCRRTIVMNRD
jgi:hypothetical protein